MQTTAGTSLTAPTSAPREAYDRRALAWWAVLSLSVYFLDQVTKWWAQRSLADGESRQLIGSFLQVRLTHNPGAAFSTGTGYTVVLTFIALAVVATCLRLATRLHSLGWATALGLLLGGALGNVTDRIVREPAPFRGHVIDFLELPHWPIFNVADSSICCAAAVFVLLSIRGVHLDGRSDDASTSS